MMNRDIVSSSIYKYIQCLFAYENMCTEENKPTGVSAFPGISPGWGGVHPACFAEYRAVGVRAWVSGECIWRMASKRVEETAEWFFPL